MKVRLQENATGTVKDVEFAEDQPGPPGNIGRLYEAFAGGQAYPDWKWAVKRHAWVNTLYESDRSIGQAFIVLVSAYILFRAPD